MGTDLPSSGRARGRTRRMRLHMRVRMCEHGTGKMCEPVAHGCSKPQVAKHTHCRPSAAGSSLQGNNAT